jgi:hypothetical protein
MDIWIYKLITCKLRNWMVGKPKWERVNGTISNVSPNEEFNVKFPVTNKPYLHFTILRFLFTHKRQLKFAMHIMQTSSVFQRHT